MIYEEWLCSSFTLCDLVTTSESGNFDSSAQTVINSDFWPQPAYSPSSIQHTLETYSRLLDATEQNIDLIQLFAQMTAKAIIDSAVKIRDPSESVKVRQGDVERFAEELTVHVYCKALEEMERHPYSDDPSSKNTDDGVMDGIYENAASLCSSGYNCDKNTSDMETDNKMEQYDDTSALAYTPSWKSMASFGSIEYPDAPPSTPLLPEMMRSRASFTRKLKGGLAKEFLPSTPPPTPKDHMQTLPENQMTDASADFMVRLMRSLSLECGQNGGLQEDEGEFDEGRLHIDISRLAEYAEQLSADILNVITTNELNVKEEGCVSAIANQLVSEIVRTSLAEVIAREDMPSDRRSRMQYSATDGVKVFVSELIINAVVQAFAKLKQGVLKHETQTDLSGQVEESQPWEEERYSNKQYKDSNDSHKAKTVRCWNKSELNTITADDMKVTSLLHRFSNDLAEDVLQRSVCDASSLLFNCKSRGAEIGFQKDVKPCVIKIHTEESRHVRELQCALLWAAVSQRRSSALQFDLPDTDLQQQLCRLSQSARLNSWTVGALMAALHEFCNIHQESSRGRYKSSQSLLQHLQHLIDNVCLN